MIRLYVRRWRRQDFSLFLALPPRDRYLGFGKKSSFPAPFLSAGIMFALLVTTTLDALQQLQMEDKALIRPFVRFQAASFFEAAA